MSQGFSDSAGRVALTLVDSLDTLWLMGMKEEFRSGLQWVEESLALESLQEVSVADYGARLLGGLLAALLCGKVGKRSNKRLVKSHKKLRSV